MNGQDKPLTQDEIKQAKIEAWRIVYRNSRSTMLLACKELALLGEDVKQEGLDKALIEKVCRE